MWSLRDIGVSSFLAAAMVLAFTACDEDDDDGGAGGKGGGSLGGVFSGFISGEGGGPDDRGGANPGDPGGGGIEPTETNCRQVCAEVLECVGVVCGVELPEDVVSQGVADCVPGCVDDTTAAGLGAIHRAAGNRCAGLQQSPDFRAVCDQVEGDGEGYEDDYGEDYEGEQGGA